VSNMPKLVATGLSQHEFEAATSQPVGSALNADAAGSSAAHTITADQRTWIDQHTVDTYEPNCCCPFTNPEGVGYVLAQALPVGTVTMAGVFFSAAVLELASIAAGCGSLQADDGGDDGNDDCKGRVHGLRPANVYILVTTVGSLSAAVMNPLLGAVCDNTRFRKSVAASALLSLASITWAQAFISGDNWFVMCCLQAPNIAFYMAHSTAVSAYLPELSDQQAELTSFGSVSTKWMFATEVSFVSIVTVLGISLFGLEDSLRTARLSQGISG